MLLFAIRNLLSRPARSLLSLMGLTVAILGMVGLFAVAEGIDHMISDTFGRIPGLAAMQRGAPIPLFSRVPRAWAEEVEQMPGVHAVSAEIWLRANIVNGRTVVSPPRFLFGADVDAHLRMRFSIYQSAVKEGRYLNREDRGRPNAVISRQIAEQYRLKPGDAMEVNGLELQVVGIYHLGSLLLDTVILVDQEFLREQGLFDDLAVSSFYIEPTGEIPNEELAARIRDRFRDRHLDSWSPSTSLLSNFGGAPRPRWKSPSGNPLVDAINAADRSIKSLHPKAETSPLDAGHQPANPSGGQATRADSSGSNSEDSDEDSGPLDIRSAADWAERFEEFSGDLKIFLTIMTSIGLTIAVLSIINTMLMSVSERIIEFGILKANGWSGRSVMTLITLESAVLGFAGGVTGCGTGVVMTHIINAQWPEHVYLVASPRLLIFSLLFSMVLGVLGGLYPAIWATRMMPMDAIRRG